MFQLIFHPKAEAELLDGFNWYERKQTGLGIEFFEEVDVLLATVVVSPHRYKLIKKAYHEVVVNRFPYVITYKINQTKNIIFISAVYHTSRNPKQKFRK